MTTNRKISTITGVLFIIATAANLVGSSITDPILKTQDYLTGISGQWNQIMIGALFLFIAAATSAGIAISLYPVLRKWSEGLALGAVGFRLIEAVFYIIGILCFLSLLPLSREFVNAGSQGALYFQTLGSVILAIRDLANFGFGVMAFCLGAWMYYSIFYQTKLVPRWLSIWGLLAILSLLSAVLITLFNGEPFAISGNLLFLVLPIAVQEIVLAVWLIVKGFNPSTTA